MYSPPSEPKHKLIWVSYTRIELSVPEESLRTEHVRLRVLSRIMQYLPVETLDTTSIQQQNGEPYQTFTMTPVP